MGFVSSCGLISSVLRVCRSREPETGEASTLGYKVERKRSKLAREECKEYILSGYEKKSPVRAGA